MPTGFPFLITWNSKFSYVSSPSFSRGRLVILTSTSSPAFNPSISDSVISVEPITVPAPRVAMPEIYDSFSDASSTEEVVGPAGSCPACPGASAGFSGCPSVSVELPAVSPGVWFVVVLFCPVLPLPWASKGKSLSPSWDPSSCP